jgi:hypothetical protein
MKLRGINRRDFTGLLSEMRDKVARGGLTPGVWDTLVAGS